MPQLYMIIPVGGGDRPDNTLPGSVPPVDPGYSPPWARPGRGPVDPGYGIDIGHRPTHPIYNPAYPDHGLPQPPLGTWGGGNVPFPTPPIYIPGQPILPDAGDPTKAHIVVYVPGAGAVSFTVDLTQLPEPTPPTEAAPK